MELTAENVETIFRDCLFTDVEVREITDLHLTPEQELAAESPHFIPVRGVVTNCAFHPGRLESHHDEVREMLMELPDTFQQSVGGGWSFLNLCMGANGGQWTGLQQTAERLALLGIALGLGTWIPAPEMRELWTALPGGVPYFIVLDEVKDLKS